MENNPNLLNTRWISKHDNKVWEVVGVVMGGRVKLKCGFSTIWLHPRELVENYKEIK